jgi:4-hydroxy-tetrahydrodipicolinate reductase
VTTSAIRVCIAGVSGWAGSEVARAVLDSPQFVLTGAIARKVAGRDVGEVLGRVRKGIAVSSTIDEALRMSTDVLIDFTEPTTVKQRTLSSLDKGVRVVIGTSGLTADDYSVIEAKAVSSGLGVIACGNFSITAALAKRFSLIAAEYLPSREILDYAGTDKIDAPSGTTREIAEEMARISPNELGLPLKDTLGKAEARGASIAGTQVHSLRLPSYMISFETIFGLPDERLTIRHDAGTGAKPYVNGTLLAVRSVLRITGLVRGMDRLLFSADGHGGCKR